MRVAIYLRVSTGSQTAENQRLDLARVAEQRGWVVVDTYTDAGVSGAKGRDQRPQFDRLCNDAAQGKFNLVAAWAIDRLGRSVFHLSQFAADLQAQNVGLYFYKQSIDTTTAAGKLFFHVLAAIAEFERGITIERIHSGMARAKAVGTRSGKAIGRPRVTHDVERRIRKLRAKGKGIVAIAKTLRCGVGTVTRVIAAPPA
jgi:DNA invertase Pin-like site-specific DNA recombinase